MTEEVRTMIGRALRDEPPLRIDRAGVLEAGRRRLRRRRTAAVALTALAALAVASASAVAGGLLGAPADTGSTGGPAGTGCVREGLPPELRPNRGELAESARLTEAFATIDLPDGVRPDPARPRLCAGGGGWHTELSVTAGGAKRHLTVMVLSPAAQWRDKGCVDAPAGSCRQQTLQDGTVVEVVDLKPTEPDVLPTVTVMAWRQDGTVVIIIDSATSRDARRMLSDEQLIALATAPQLRVRWSGRPGLSESSQRGADELTAVLATAADLLPAGMRAVASPDGGGAAALEFEPRGGSYGAAATLVDAAGSGSFYIEVYENPSGNEATCAALLGCTEVTLPDGTPARALLDSVDGVDTVTVITTRPNGRYVVASCSNSGPEGDSAGPTRPQVPLDVAALGRIAMLF